MSTVDKKAVSPDTKKLTGKKDSLNKKDGKTSNKSAAQRSKKSVNKNLLSQVPPTLPQQIHDEAVKAKFQQLLQLQRWLELQQAKTNNDCQH